MYPTRIKVVYPKDSKSVMMALVKEHIKCNLVKVHFFLWSTIYLCADCKDGQIGGRYFRQKDGIPQGSILSSFLCNLFYAHMEKAVLRFARDQASVSTV